MRRHLFFAASILVLPSCTAIPVVMGVPPIAGVTLPQNIRVLAVGYAEGREAEVLADQLAEALVTESQFRVVDRARTEQIMREHRLRSAGLLTPDQSRRLGQFTGADAYIMVRVLGYRTERYQGRLGYSETRAVVEFQAQVIDLRTAEVVAARNIIRSATSEADVASLLADVAIARTRDRPEVQRTQSDPAALLAKARQRAATDFARALRR